MTPTRRSLLKLGSLTAIAVSMFPTGVVARNSGANLIEGGAKKEKPSKNVDSTRVSLFRDDYMVPTGDWIDHDFSIVQEESTEEVFLEEIVPSLRVWIGGEEIDDPTQYLSDPFRNDEGELEVDWDFFTPPKPPGSYGFTAEIITDSGTGIYTVG